LLVSFKKLYCSQGKYTIPLYLCLFQIGDGYRKAVGSQYGQPFIIAGSGTLGWEQVCTSYDWPLPDLFTPFNLRLAPIWWSVGIKLSC